MAFSYTAALTDDVSVVRFRIGDNKEDGHYLEDAEIQYWIDNTTALGAAMVRCIEYIITQLSQPNFKLDWLTVSNEEARKGYENLLKKIAQEEGVSLASISAGSAIGLPRRADSYQEDAEYDGAP